MPSPVRELLRLPTDHSRIPRGRLKLDWTCRNAMLESRALRGAVAQLGERRVRNAKVEGSIPFRSIFPPSMAVHELLRPSTTGPSMTAEQAKAAAARRTILFCFLVALCEGLDLQA